MRFFGNFSIVVCLEIHVHLNPIRTDIAKQIGYINLKHGEDLDYSNRLKASGLVKLEDEHFIDETMYYYLYVPKRR